MKNGSRINSCDCYRRFLARLYVGYFSGVNMGNKEIIDLKMLVFPYADLYERYKNKLVEKIERDEILAWKKEGKLSQYFFFMMRECLGDIVWTYSEEVLQKVSEQFSNDFMEDVGLA